MPVAAVAQESAAVRSRIDPQSDPEGWVRNNERITNEADFDAWLALYAPDVVFEAITDGASDRSEGLENVAISIRALGAICKRHRLHVTKRFVAAQGDTIVNTWSGGFEGRDRQFGMEIWTLRGDKVTRHEQYTFLDVRSSASPLAKFRALFSGELAIKLELAAGRKETQPRAPHAAP